MAESRNDKNLVFIDPECRALIPIEKFHVSKSLSRLVNKRPFSITMNQAFSSVIHKCATINRDNTWINLEIEKLFITLNEMRYAHSIECWHEGELIGGLYGIAIGKAFFGESMFSRKSNSSKIAFAFLCKKLSDWGFEIIDCQVHNPHLESLGAIEIPRSDFLQKLNTAITLEPNEEWHFG